jgi:16S rRNA (uracil1498-N3)-methyltransferase
MTMQMELFYSQSIEADRVYFDAEESHHCAKVMRHKMGDKLMVTDGRGKLYRAKILNDDWKAVVLEILETVKEVPAAAPIIHIAIAPTKNIDRFEWFLEKATEIGVDEITPILCHRSGRDKIKHARLEKMLISAMKQSLRLWLPALNGLISFEEFLTGKSMNTGNRFLCHCQSQDLPLLKNLYQEKNNALIIIGPEGDFTSEEINLAEANGFVSVSLGSARLRTETAGMVAVQTIQLINQ